MLRRFDKTSFCLVIFLSLVKVCLTRTGFVKDQNEDLVTFPPHIVEASDSPIPTGHLRPLGWHRNPDREIEEQLTLPAPRDFYEQFVKPGVPVVFRNATIDAPALSNWKKTNYLRDKYGQIDVDVTVKKELLASGPRKMKFSKFIKEFRYEDWYLSNFVPTEMMSELRLPKSLKCGFRKWLMESEIWMSSGGTASLLHSHADHDLHCLLAGRKDFIFIEWKNRGDLAFHDQKPFRGAGHSELDTDRINMFKYPKVAHVPWTWSTLRAGDCVFVPAGYLHQVCSYGLSISSTNHFSPSPDINFSDCDSEVNLDVPVPLTDASFLWSYSNGQLLLSNPRLDSASMRHHLLMVMRNEEELTFEVFQKFYQEVMEEANDYPEDQTIWTIIAEDDAKTITREQLKELSDDDLQTLAEVFNLPHQQLSQKSNLLREDL